VYINHTRARATVRILPSGHEDGRRRRRRFQFVNESREHFDRRQKRRWGKKGVVDGERVDRERARVGSRSSVGRSAAQLFVFITQLRRRRRRRVYGAAVTPAALSVHLSVGGYRFGLYAHRPSSPPRVEYVRITCERDDYYDGVRRQPIIRPRFP